MDRDEIAGLMREVIARPDDDGVRAVLADVLQAAGDPRGELISLQLLAARGNRDRDARIEELLHANARHWLGLLRECANACCFDRGFPTRLELASPWGPDDIRWVDALCDSALATVEDLLRGSAHVTTYTRFVTSPALVNLRRIEVTDRAMLTAFVETPNPIEHVAFDQPMHETPPLAPFLAACAARPTLTSLAVRAEHVPRLLAQPWFARIRSLTVVGGVQRALELWPQLHCDLVIVPRPTLEPCARLFPWDYKVEVRRDGVARISGEWLLYPVFALAALPTVSRVEIELASELIAGRVREVIARPGVEVVERPPRTSNFIWSR